jgi:hypothetical protein
MIQTTVDRRNDQERRILTKNQDHQLIQRAIHGAGLSPWEAQILVEAVEEVYFAQGSAQIFRDGQMRYECIAAEEPAGKPLVECKTVGVVLTVLHRDDGILQDAAGQRQQRICRLCEEARQQDGLLSQEDLARILMCDTRTIRRDIAALRKRGIEVPTRGQQKDIGPTVSHKGVAVRLWVEGAEPVDVARKINHSLHAVERYLNTFSRVSFLLEKRFTSLQIALTVGISTAQVKTYQELYSQYRPKRQYAQRFEEVRLIGQQHYDALDEKKGAISRSKSSKNGRRTP